MSRSASRRRQTTACRAVLLQVVLGVGGCGSEAPPSTVLFVGGDAGEPLEPAPETAARAWVGPDGGRVASSDGACRVLVPEGALPRAAWVRFDAQRDGGWLLTWQGLSLARPVIIQCLPPPGSVTFELRLERVGLGANDRERLPTLAVGAEGWLTTWTWGEGVLRFGRSACSPDGPHGQPTCRADPRERCLMSPEVPLARACGFGCTVDVECPVGHACQSGRCAPRACGHPAECRVSEACAGVGSLRFCLPTTPPRRCEEGCGDGERCVRTSSAADAGARCGRPFEGCVGTSVACPVVTFDAFEGIERPGRAVEAPTWALGARLSDVQGSVVAFVNPTESPAECEPNFRGRTGFVWWANTRFSSAVFSINDCGDDRERPNRSPQLIQKRLSLFAMPPIQDVQPRVGSAGEAVVSWTAPRAGRVWVDLGLTPSGNEVMSSRAVAARLDHRSGAQRSVRFGGRTFLSDTRDLEVRAHDEFSVLEGDTLELSFPSRVGGVITQSQTYLDWQITYVEVR